MKLQEYLDKNSLSYTAFAKMIDVTPQAARRYALEERTPEKDVMKRINAKTGKKVMPNDFYS